VAILAVFMVSRYRLRDVVARTDMCLSSASPANPMFSEVERPGIGRHLMPRTPLQSSSLPSTESRPEPLLGEHTDEILADVLGISENEIGRLHDADVVATAAEQDRVKPRS
jgi:2-methylfumaryl-CoA isomerase